MLLADVFFDVRMFGEFPAGMQSLQRRARRHATINVVDFNDVTRCQNMELELELIQTQMAQKPMLRAEVGMRVRCANKASAE